MKLHEVLDLNPMSPGYNGGPDEHDPNDMPTLPTVRFVAGQGNASPNRKQPYDYCIIMTCPNNKEEGEVLEYASIKIEEDPDFSNINVVDSEGQVNGKLYVVTVFCAGDPSKVDTAAYAAAFKDYATEQAEKIAMQRTDDRWAEGKHIAKPPRPSR